MLLLPGAYGDGPIAALAAGGGSSGDGSITPLDFNGNALKPIATGLGGVHANILAVSPDGRVRMVADRLASRIVCIEEA